MVERGDIQVFYCPDCREKRAHVYTIDENDYSSLQDEKRRFYVNRSIIGYYYALVWKCTTCNRKIAV